NAREMFESSRSRRQPADAVNQTTPAPHRTKPLRTAIFAILLLAAGFALARRDLWLRSAPPAGSTPFPSLADAQVVKPGESIAAAVERAAPGSQIIVEPGEYRERVLLKDGIRLVSRVPRGATIRLPGATSDTDLVPAVVADHVSHAELIGFRIIGDAA